MVHNFGEQDSPSSPRGPPFAQPGNLTVLNAEAWSNTVSGIIDTIIVNKPSAQFHNPAIQPREQEAGSLPIKWRAFPKNFDNRGRDKMALADIRDNQDEYCEWEVARNSDGKVSKVTFTCELPEYWQQLAKENPQTLVDQYREIIGTRNITREDLFQGGEYNIDNKWNYRAPGIANISSLAGCIVHMRRKNNTMFEAVDLVADASILRAEADGTPITDPIQLLSELKVSEQSSRRESDPEIVRAINEQARKKQSIGVENPAGMYIDSFDSEDFDAPDEGDVGDFWKFTRGSDGRYVRAELEVPAERGYLVGDIKDPTHRPIRHGSQVAKYVWVSFTAQNIPQEKVVRRPAASQSSQTGIYQYIEGRDVQPFELDQSSVTSKLEPEYFGRLLAAARGENKPAITFSKFLAALPPYTWRAYAADEGIGLKFQGPRPKARVRITIICTPGTPTGPSVDHPGSQVADVNKLVANAFTTDTLTVVAVPPENDPTNIDSPRAFLQCASYSKTLGWFNFYDRERSPPENGPPRWLFFGCSRDAFTPDTQGLGPFCGHANGGIIMKEIDEPWLHWHTSNNSLDIPDDHPLHRQKPLKGAAGRWNFGSGTDLARMILKGTRAWFKKRLELDFGPGALAIPRNPNPIATRVHQWLAHVLLTTSINIRVSTSGDRSTFEIPEEFCFNRRALRLVLENLADMDDDLALDAIPRSAYETARKDLGLSTFYEYGSDSKDDKMAMDAEGQAPWKILVPCREDEEGIKWILSVGLLSKKEIAALLMVDFWNPIYSWRRAQLMRYVPSTARFDGKKYQLGDGLTKAIRVGATYTAKDSPEAEYLRLIDEPGDFNVKCPQIIAEYVANVNNNLRTVRGTLKSYMRLAESRRRMFKSPPRSRMPSHPLAEFNMQLPYASRMDEGQGPLFMRQDGKVDGEQSPGKIWHPRNTQAHFSASGCPFSASE